jgi:Rrf2 family protein
MCGLGTRPGAYTSVADLAQRHDIPRTFLEQVLLRTKQADLTVSRRGPDGGYMLAKPPREIRVGDIYAAVAGSLNLCADSGEPDAADPSTRSLWRDLETTIRDFLNSVTLDDLLERPTDRGEGRPVGHSYTFSI